MVDDGMRNVRRELRVVLHHGNWARAPSFVRRCTRRGAANGEGGNHVQAEARGVVVVDKKDDVGRVVLDPLLGERIAMKDLLAERIVGLALVQRRADPRRGRSSSTA